MLDDKTRALAEAKNFAAFSTITPSGHPQTQMMWVDTDGEHIIVNTEIDRAKFRNIERNPLVTVLIADAGDPWNYSEVRGRVVEKVRGPEAKAHIDAMAKKYLDKDVYPNPIRSERVMIKIAPDRIVKYPAGT